MNNPLFSIITVCYNSEHTIRRTIESILVQDYLNYEYLIIDGASNDRTLDIAREYENSFEGRMHIYSEPDKGIYDAFNKGIERSNGVYCWLVNSDDYIEPHALQNVANHYERIKMNSNPILVGAMNFVSKKGKVLSVWKYSSWSIADGLKKDYIGVPHPATLVPKAIYNQYGAYDIYYKIIGDADWFRRVCLAGVTFEGMDVVITNLSEGGISDQILMRKEIRDRVHYLNKFYSNPAVWLLHFLRWIKAICINKVKSNLRNK